MESEWETEIRELETPRMSVKKLKKCRAKPRFKIVSLNCLILIAVS
jgi:hypothetical protein